MHWSSFAFIVHSAPIGEGHTSLKLVYRAVVRAVTLPFVSDRCVGESVGTISKAAANVSSEGLRAFRASSEHRSGTDSARTAFAARVQAARRPGRSRCRYSATVLRWIAQILRRGRDMPRRQRRLGYGDCEGRRGLEACGVAKLAPRVALFRPGLPPRWCRSHGRESRLRRRKDYQRRRAGLVLGTGLRDEISSVKVQLLRGAVLALGCAAAACAQPRDDAARASGCVVQVIVTLQSSPDDALVADLARVTGARLTLVRTMTSNLHLFSIEAGPEPECDAAIERLRSDPRVRAVDLDRRRQIQSP
jgi:hypothetical protein